MFSSNKYLYFLDTYQKEQSQSKGVYWYGKNVFIWINYFKIIKNSVSSVHTLANHSLRSRLFQIFPAFSKSIQSIVLWLENKNWNFEKVWGKGGGGVLRITRLNGLLIKNNAYSIFVLHHLKTTIAPFIGKKNGCPSNSRGKLVVF